MGYSKYAKASMAAQTSYLLQVIPVICFAALPMILFSTLANVFGWPQFFVDVFVPFNYLSMILNLLNTFYMELPVNF